MLSNTRALKSRVPCRDRGQYLWGNTLKRTRRLAGAPQTSPLQQLKENFPPFVSARPTLPDCQTPSKAALWLILKSDRQTGEVNYRAAVAIWLAVFLWRRSTYLHLLQQSAKVQYLGVHRKNCLQGNWTLGRVGRWINFILIKRACGNTKMHPLSPQRGGNNLELVHIRVDKFLYERKNSINSHIPYHSRPCINHIRNRV